MFTKAIVRKPALNFAEGLTSVDLGIPDVHLALEQWAAYCAALKTCGLAITELPEDSAHPDSTFVEDAAIVTPLAANGRAILTRPGATSRLGEVAAIASTVRHFYPEAGEIQSPGTLDGGDICEAGRHFFLGISKRTNQEGARQLANHLAQEGFSTSNIDVRHMTSILHLKSGISYIGDNVLVVMEEMASWPEFSSYDLLTVSKEESYAANCVRVNDHVLVAKGYQNLTANLISKGFNPLILDMSEFQKMDGGLSCLSLRF